jgi:glycosyltransferase involved in cell wall biosynthesis
MNSWSAAVHQQAEPRENKTRVLHLRTVVGRGGGPEKTLLNSHRYAASAFDIRLLYIHPRDDAEFDLPFRASKCGADLTVIAERGPWDPGTLVGLVRKIRDFRPHILHAHDYKTDLLATLLSFPFRTPCVATLHGNVTQDRRLNLYYRLDRWALRRMLRVMAVSRDLREQAIASGVASEKCVLVENGVDVEHYRRANLQAAAKSTLGIPSDSFLLGAVGRLMPEKGFDLLIRAVAPLCDEFPNVRLQIAGDGTERRRLEAIINQLDCAGRIELVGHRADVRDLLEACDVFVLSSRREAFPNVVLEAMAMETPVVASRIAGLPQLIIDGETGLLVEPDNVEGFTTAVRRLIESKSLRNRLTSAARALVETRFTFAERMRKEFDVYDELLGTKSIEPP